MPAQLVFDLTAPPALEREDFFVSEANRLAVAALAAPAGWPQGKMLLTGAEGAGKTHLALIWAADNAAVVLSADELGPAPDAGPVVVEDVHRVAGNAVAEQALFHLHNQVLASGRRLLMTARSAPRGWGLRLPDLASRMEATATAALAPPDDALLAAVLVKLFADRQIAVPAPLIPWLVTRMERSFASARRVVADLDARALASGRPISRGLAAEVLDSQGQAEP